MNKMVFLRSMTAILAITGSIAYGMEQQPIEIDSFLFKAIDENNYEGVQKALDKGADLNSTSIEYKNKTPLGHAIDQYYEPNRGNIAIVKLLLDHGADPDLYAIKKNGQKDESALVNTIRPNPSFGMWSPHYPLFSLLYQYGADPKKGFVLEGTTFTILPAYHPILEDTKDSMAYMNNWEKVLVKDCLMIGLLAFNLLDKKDSRLDIAMKEAHFKDTVKNTILAGKEKYLKYLQELDKEIINDLDQKEEEYLKSCIQHGKKNIFKTIQNAQINGSYSLKNQHSQEETDNPLIYNGNIYSSFRKHLYQQVDKQKSAINIEFQLPVNQQSQQQQIQSTKMENKRSINKQ